MGRFHARYFRLFTEFLVPEPLESVRKHPGQLLPSIPSAHSVAKRSGYVITNIMFVWYRLQSLFRTLVLIHIFLDNQSSNLSQNEFARERSARLIEHKVKWAAFGGTLNYAPTIF